MEAKLKDVKVFKPDVFEDHRGLYIELYNKKNLPAIEFVQDDISVSFKNVLRGIHGDAFTWKLISCLRGSIYLVVVDCVVGRWASFTLSEQNRLQVLVPPFYGIAHLVLSDWAIFHYKQSTYYDRASQFTHRYDDPRFGIKWPTKDPILSKRDKEINCVS